jgi:hypothetical protein
MKIDSVKKSLNKVEKSMSNFPISKAEESKKILAKRGEIDDVVISSKDEAKAFRDYMLLYSNLVKLKMLNNYVLFSLLRHSFMFQTP